MAEFLVFLVLVVCVVFFSLLLLVLLIESAVLTYEAWMYWKLKKRGELIEDDFRSREHWGFPLFGLVLGLGASVVESVLLGMLTEVWIAVLVFVLCMVLFIGMWGAIFVINMKLIPPPAD